MRSRVLSGMRPTGSMHLGHYHGALKNWVRLQDEHDCFFFVADWHALTTHYEDREVIEKTVYDMVVDWLAAGLDPDKATIFIQSRLPEHAELFTLLAMGTPLGWLERVPTYKDQIEKLRDRDLATYGFLGYPLLQAADILIYKATYVPVGEDQSSHVELTREVARRFNHLYGRAPSFEADVAAALAKLAKDDARYFDKQRKAFGETGAAEALARGEAVVRRAAAQVAGWSDADTELLLGHLHGGGKSILVEPQALHTEVLRLPGVDGTKMSKSYGNAILMRDDPETVTKKVRGMMTDPARVRRTDPGDPEKCPVWSFHKVYSDEATREWVVKGCTSAGIGCLDCKQPVIDAIVQEQQPWRERAESLLADPKKVHWIVEMGTERARTVARQTMKDVRGAMGLDY
ncbi:MAG: tryptophan--tRNA ligase [Rubrivivax sp.]|nr:tryptophan--tRNA ligase [Betaproteobacteria bacterium]MBP6317790.1 tryptophan--tRNA ligase [Rubrivivax sp.]MBK7275053.1 tryptophan--tRNA ligase [Betaproteobacteria bacterium]MBK7457425.1 tryptophan--tRNA ligase [Betaproteobacteria bacterium]MBK8865362.1 tryptophan--tRNA ligase [Betaproteobacteria bacterium]